MSVTECSGILDKINDALWEKFHISHTTIQFETKGCETTHGCSAPPQELETVGAHAHHHGHDHHHGHAH
jgi:cobalt-zinc-cadmium efflux system protein